MKKIFLFLSFRLMSIEVWAKLFSTLTDDEINEFFNKWDNKRFCFEIQEIDGKKYLVDCDKDLDNYGYKIQLI